MSITLQRLPWLHRASPSATLDKMAMYLAAGRDFVKANFSGFCHRTAAGEGVDWLRTQRCSMDLSRYQNPEFSRGAPFWKEVLWWFARTIFFEPWFPQPSRLRCAVLRAFGAKVGRGVVIRSQVNINFPWRLEIGDHVWIGEEVMILSLDRVRIGSHVCISQRAFLCTGSHKFKKETFDLVTKPIVVEDGCWIAAGAFIGPGVTLRRNTVCSAGAVLMRDAGPDAVVSGNPAVVREG